jgi:hypothetical protein
MSAAEDERSAFVTGCMAFGESASMRLAAEIADGEASIARLAGELRTKTRELHESRRRLAGLRLVATSDAARFEQDYDELIRLPGVARVEVSGTTVHVTTDPIDIVTGERTYRIGPFAIDMELDLHDEIRIRNLANTSQRDGWDHPHIQAGLPCLGNLRTGCEILLGDLQVVPLVSLLLQFLGTYDPASAYAPISLWQEIPS